MSRNADLMEKAQCCDCAMRCGVTIALSIQDEGEETGTMYKKNHAEAEKGLETRWQQVRLDLQRMSTDLVVCGDA